MSVAIDYYMAPVSPFSYLGGERLLQLGRKTGATIRVLPIDLTKVFPATGGLPLKQRSPQRRAYRMAELRRWREYLALPLVLEPKYFPVDANPASLMIIAAREQGSDALALSQRILRAVWVEENNVADPSILIKLAGDVDLDGSALAERSNAPDVAALYERDTQAAIERGVFGVPTYAVDDELFWGQDRLEFLGRKLS